MTISVIENANIANELGNAFFWAAFPKGPGKRAKRSSMRKAVKCYTTALDCIKDIHTPVVKSIDPEIPDVDMIEFRFKLTINLANAYRSLCELDNLQSAIRALDDIAVSDVLEDDDNRSDEYELRIMACEGNALVAMYRAGYDHAKLEDASRIFEEMESAPGFIKMSAGFRSTHWHYVGFLSILLGDNAKAVSALNLSVQLRHDQETFKPKVLKWTQKLLNKANKRVERDKQITNDSVSYPECVMCP